MLVETEDEKDQASDAISSQILNIVANSEVNICLLTLAFVNLTLYLVL